MGHNSEKSTESVVWTSSNLNSPSLPWQQIFHIILLRQQAGPSIFYLVKPANGHKVQGNSKRKQ